MSSGKKKSQPIQQAPAPTYGAQENSQWFTPWGPAQVGYDAIASQMGIQAGLGPQYVQPSAETLNAINSMGALGYNAIQNFNFLSNAADVANNPQVQAMAKANEQQVNQNLQRNMLPALQNAGVGGGGLGSSRLGLAQGQALGDTSRNLANTNAQMMLGAYGQGLNAQAQALGSLGSLQQALLMPGQARESYEQARINAPWQYMQNMGAATQYLSPLGRQHGFGQTGPAGGFAPYAPMNPYGQPQNPWGDPYASMNPYGQPQNPWGDPNDPYNPMRYNQ